MNIVQMADRVPIFDRMTNPKAPIGDVTLVKAGDAVVYRDEDFAYRTRLVAKVTQGRSGCVLVLKAVPMDIGGVVHVLDMSYRLPLSSVLRVLRSPEEIERLANLPPPKAISEILAPGSGRASTKEPKVFKQAVVATLDKPVIGRTVADITKSWKNLTTKGLYKEAADAILGFLDQGCSDSAVVLLWFRAAQLYACANEPAHAIDLMANAISTARGHSDWNAYVQATIGFLRGDENLLRAEIRKAGQFGYVVKGLLQAMRSGVTDYQKAHERACGGPIHSARSPVPSVI